MTEQLLIALASIITLGIAAEWLAWRIHLPSILMLLIFGFVAGPVTGFIRPDEMLGPVLFPIVSIAVAVILFEGGTSLRLRELREIGGVVRNLVTIGALLAWVLGAAAAYLLLGLNLALAALLGAVLVVTGPTVIIPLLRHVRPTQQVASTLKWEGILIDPIGAVLAVLVYEAVVAGSVGAATTVAILGLVKTIVVGAALAAAGAGLLIVLIDRQWVPDFLQSPLALMVVVTAFAFSNVLQPESGLLTATLMGVALANQRTVDIRHIVEFKENLRVLLISSLFILLGARLQPADLSGIGLPELAFLGALMLVIRPAVVGVSTLGSEMGWRERVMIAGIAPRGIVAAAVASVFTLELVHAGYAGAERLVPLTFMVIIGTVAIYGLTATPVARLLKVAQPQAQGLLIVGAHPWARAIAQELAEAGVPVRLADTNYSNIAEARLAGLPVHYGSAITESALDSIELDGIGRLLALTSNDDVNSLSALHFGDIFGGEDVFQLPPEHLSEDDPREVTSWRLRGKFVFHPDANYWNLTARFDAGADIKTTNLTETFDFQRFMELYDDAIPLFTLDADGRLEIFTVDDPPQPGPGQMLIAIVEPVDEPAEVGTPGTPST